MIRVVLCLLILLPAPLRAQPAPPDDLLLDEPYDTARHPLDSRDAQILTQSGYRLENDRVYASSASQPVGREDLSFILEDLRSRRRLRALLELDMVFTRSGFGKDIPSEDQEELKRIARTYWGILPNQTRKELKPYFSVQELEELNLKMPLGPPPPPRAPRVYEVEASTPEAPPAPAPKAKEAAKPAPPPPLLLAKTLAPLPAANALQTPEEEVVALPAPWASEAALSVQNAGKTAALPPAPSVGVRSARPPSPSTKEQGWESAAKPSAAAAALPVPAAPAPAAATPAPPPAAPVTPPVSPPAPPPPAVPAQVAAPVAAPAPALPQPPPATPEPASPAAPTESRPSLPPSPAGEAERGGVAVPMETRLPPPAAAAPVPTYREASAFSPEEFQRFLAGAPYSAEVKSLLELLSAHAKDPERRIALGIVRELLPSISLDSVQAGASSRSVVFGRDKDLLRPGHGRIALNDGPVLLRWKKLFDRRSALLPDSPDWYAALGLPRPALEAFSRTNGAERTVDDEVGRLRAYRDGSWRLSLSKEQLAGELLAALMDADARLRGWPDDVHVRLRSASARWRFWKTLTKLEGRLPPLDREAALAFSEWLERPEDSTDIFYLQSPSTPAGHYALLQTAGVVDPAYAEALRAKLPVQAKAAPGLQELVPSAPQAREQWIEIERLAREEP